MFNPGETFETYKIVRSLGKGGMGQVFLALDTQLERHVALKILHLDVDEETHGVRARFLKEAKILASFDHPNIVRIFAIGEYQGCPYIVMEYIEGQTLLSLIKKEELDINNKLILMRNILVGIGEAHDKGVLHRDIKPANIILCSRSGIPKILDFGISKEIKEDSSVITNAESIMGTVSYMAPEQIQLAEVSPQSDIFSMGVLFYELFTGKNPFKTENNVSTMYKICNKVISLVTDAPDEVPQNTRMIVDKMISKEVLDRYYSVEDILTDVDSKDSLSLPELHTLVGVDDDSDLMTRHQAMETLGELGYNEGQVEAILSNAQLEIEDVTTTMGDIVDLKFVGHAIDNFEKNKPKSHHNIVVPQSVEGIKWWRVGALVMMGMLSGFYFFGEMISPGKRVLASVKTSEVQPEPPVENVKELMTRIYLVRMKNMDTGVIEQHREKLQVVSQSGDFYYGKLINEKTGKENQVQFVANPFLPPLRKVANVGEEEIRNVIHRAHNIMPVTKGKRFKYLIDHYQGEQKTQIEVKCQAGASTVYRLKNKDLQALEISCFSKSADKKIRTDLVYSAEHNLILSEEKYIKMNGDRFKEIRELIEL